MADYKVIGIADATVANGDAGDDTVRSSFSRPSILERGARYMRCDFGVSVAVTGDLSTFVSVNGGKITLDHMPNDSDGYGWPKAFLAASLGNFQLAPKEGTPNVFQIWQEKGDKYTDVTFSRSTSFDEGSAVTSDTSVFYADFGIYTPKGGGAAYSWAQGNWTDPTVNPSAGSYLFPGKSAQVAVGTTFSGTSFNGLLSSMSKLGYSYIGKLGDAEWGDGETYRTGYVYVSGICLFNDDAPGGVKWNRSVRIPVSGLRDFLEYYPWARYVGGEWRSHNRPGGSLKRYNGGWKDVKNSQGPGASKGFRHNGSTWAKSPKTGRE